LAFAKAPTLGQFNAAFTDEIHQLNIETIRQYADFRILAD